MSTQLKTHFDLLNRCEQDPTLSRGSLDGPNGSGFTVFNYFHQKQHLRSLTGKICLCMYLVPQIWR